jgi:hypothetical protein
MSGILYDEGDVVAAERLKQLVEILLHLGAHSTMFSSGHVFGIDDYGKPIVDGLLEVLPVVRQGTGEGLDKKNQVREEVVANNHSLLLAQPLPKEFEVLVDVTLIALGGAVIIGLQPAWWESF